MLHFAHPKIKIWRENYTHMPELRGEQKHLIHWSNVPQFTQAREEIVKSAYKMA